MICGNAFNLLKMYQKLVDVEDFIQTFYDLKFLYSAIFLLTPPPHCTFVPLLYWSGDVYSDSKVQNLPNVKNVQNVLNVPIIPGAK